MPKKRSSTSVLRGRVVSHNISPKGHVEGILIDSDDAITQVNYPKHAATNLAKRFPVGRAVELAVELEDDSGEHPVYVIDEIADDVAGTVMRFNYALHGEINGYHLDNGTFVHVKPDGARRYKVALGDRIVATGPRHEGIDAVVVEAEGVSKEAARSTTARASSKRASSKRTSAPAGKRRRAR